MEGMRLKACSTSTDVEAADHEGTKPLQEAERELQKSEEEIPTTKPKRKKQKMTPKIKEMKKVRKSLTETVKKLPETSLVQAGLPFKEKGTTPEEKYECCHESKESAVLNSMEDTIFVKGFDPSLARDDIKTALRTHFGTCGKVTRVYVPTECKTGATIGYAFVDMRSSSVEKALKLSGSSLGGWNLEVMMAKDRSEFYNLTNFRGCERCFVNILNRNVARFNVTRGGRIIPTKFKVEP